MHHESVPLHCRTTLAQKLHTEYVEKLKAYKCHKLIHAEK
jgi:hypothetical protein